MNATLLATARALPSISPYPAEASIQVLTKNVSFVQDTLSKIESGLATSTVEVERQLYQEAQRLKKAGIEDVNMRRDSLAGLITQMDASRWTDLIGVQKNDSQESLQETDCEFDKKYEKLTDIESGAEGYMEVYRHRETGDLVAVKTIEIKNLDDFTETTIKQIGREARALSSFSHSNVIKYRERHTRKNPAKSSIDFISVFDFIKGRSIAQLIRDGHKFTTDELKRMDSQISDALAACHASGITHRDVKPGNIMATWNEQGKMNFILVDFGIAKITSQQTRASSVFMGTTEYMSPEQLHGSDITHSTDIYSLGLTITAAALGRERTNWIIAEQGSPESDFKYLVQSRDTDLGLDFLCDLHAKLNRNPSLRSFKSTVKHTKESLLADTTEFETEGLVSEEAKSLTELNVVVDILAWVMHERGMSNEDAINHYFSTRNAEKDQDLKDIVNRAFEYINKFVDFDISNVSVFNNLMKRWGMSVDEFNRLKDFASIENPQANDELKRAIFKGLKFTNSYVQKISQKRSGWLARWRHSSRINFINPNTKFQTEDNAENPVDNVQKKIELSEIDNFARRIGMNQDFSYGETFSKIVLQKLYSSLSTYKGTLTAEDLKLIIQIIPFGYTYHQNDSFGFKQKLYWPYDWMPVNIIVLMLALRITVEIDLDFDLNGLEIKLVNNLQYFFIFIDNHKDFTSYDQYTKTSILDYVQNEFTRLGQRKSRCLT